MSSAPDPGLPAPIEPPAPRAAVRIRPIAAEPEEPPLSLRERLETPVKIVAAGILLAFADPVLRPFLGGIPIRPLHVAEVLLVAGVIWIAVRLVLPARR
jgi:hypothetical protein